MRTATALSRMDDLALEATIQRLERGLDRLDSACWPSAFQQRVRCMAELDDLIREQERRRT